MHGPYQHGHQADPEVADLALALRSHAPIDQREAWSKETTLSELGRLEHPFDRWADPTHVTASAIVVGARGVVLHRHRRLHRWLQPGGHIEDGESPASAAVRECMEETGLAVAHPPGGPVLLHVDVHEANGHVHLDIRYLVSAPDQDPLPAPEESQEVAWFSWDAAASVADEALAGALAAARRLSRGTDAIGTDADAIGEEEPWSNRSTP